MVVYWLALSVLVDCPQLYREWWCHQAAPVMQPDWDKSATDLLHLRH